MDMPDNEEYINDYISGAMSPEEKEQFEARLAVDDELNLEYQLMLKAKDYINARATLEEIENDPDLPRVEAEIDAYFKENNISVPVDRDTLEKDERKFLKVLLKTIPAAVLIIGLLLLRSFFSTSPNTRLYDKYYEPVSKERIELLLVRGPVNANHQAGIACYLAKDYECAKSHFENIPEDSYYLGLALVGLEEYEGAIKSLSKYHEAYPEYPDASWYLGLAYLKENDLENALMNFEELSGKETYYSTKARKLSRRIEKMKAAAKE